MLSVKIVLADDQQLFLKAVARFLENRFDVVATAEDGERAINHVSSFDPDLLVLDVSMPVLNGLQTAARLKECGSRAKVIFLSAHEDIDLVAAALSVGASAYVLKRRLATDLIPAIQAALGGHIFTSSLVHC
jgi:DNA-binding NarL/FixJ family response regulator